MDQHPTTAPVMDATAALITAMAELITHASKAWLAKLRRRQDTTGCTITIHPSPDSIRISGVQYPTFTSTFFSAADDWPGTTNTAHEALTRRSQYAQICDTINTAAQSLTTALSAFTPLSTDCPLRIEIYPHAREGAPRVGITINNLALHSTGNTTHKSAPIQAQKLLPLLQQFLNRCASITTAPTQWWCVFPCPNSDRLTFRQHGHHSIIKAGSGDDAITMHRLLDSLALGTALPYTHDQTPLLAFPVATAHMETPNPVFFADTAQA